MRLVPCSVLVPPSALCAAAILVVALPAASRWRTHRDTAEIRADYQKLSTAVRQDDLNGQEEFIRRKTTPDMNVRDATEPDPRESCYNRQDLLDAIEVERRLQRHAGGNTVPLELTVQSVSLHGDTATVKTRLIGHYSRNMEDLWVRTPGGWKLREIQIIDRHR